MNEDVLLPFLKTQTAFNERTRGMTLLVKGGDQTADYPGDSQLHVRIKWQRRKIVEAAIENSDFVFIGHWLGKIEII